MPILANYPCSGAGATVPTHGKALFFRLLGSAVLMQALLSGSSLIVGLVLLRRTADLQYGYFVLMQNSIVLLTILQGAFIQPQLVTGISRADAVGRADLVGGLYRAQRRLWAVAGGVILACTLLLWLGRILTVMTALIVLAAGAAATGSLYREFFRMVLLGNRRPVDVLRADTVYTALLVGGAFIATLTPAPAALAGLTMAFAALVGGVLCSKALWRFEPWNIRGAPGILRSFAPLGRWSAGGASVHWLMNQGYSYLVAGVLNVPAVAAIAATRLTIMPINLLSTGIGTVMLPTAATWMDRDGAAKVFRRSITLAMMLSILAIGYLTTLWWGRDWLFTHVLKKQFAHRDSLLLLWFAVCLIMLLRDQLLYLLTVRHRFRPLTTLTFIISLLSLSISYLGMLRLGVVGALLGVLIGELLNVIGLLVLSILEIRRRIPTVAT
jgi:O-antigen/teichoic acid export membrane protein